MSSADPRGCTELELASIPVLMIKAESPEMWLLVHKKLTMPVLEHNLFSDWRIVRVLFS